MLQNDPNSPTNFTPEVTRALHLIQHWDWSSVHALKQALELIRDSPDCVYSRYLDDLIRELTSKTEKRLIVPVHARRIIAVDLNGEALTGNIEDLRIEKVPYDQNNVR